MSSSSSTTTNKIIILISSILLIFGQDYFIPRRRCSIQEQLLADPVIQPECFFHDSYEEAKKAFQQEIQFTNGELNLVSLPIYTPNGTLSIDVGYRIKNSSNVLVVISGTHGVEGYAGSAIQLATIRALRTRKLLQTTQASLIFVHILNPYGMKFNRRTNENNVDLNRNAVFSQEMWKLLLARSPNIAGYEDYNDIFNPTGPFSFYHLFSACWNMIITGRFSVNRIKRAAVTGTHTNPKGVYYMGNKPEPSHVAMANFFNSYGFISQAKRVIMNDIHSGLGPQGMDSWMMYGEQVTPRLRKVVEQTYGRMSRNGSIMSILRSRNGSDDDQLTNIININPYALEFDYSGISEGYDLVVSDVQKGYIDLFKQQVKEKSGWAFCYSQEFGTVASILVLNSVVVENAALFYGTEEDLKRARVQTRQAFYPDNQYFAREVVNRGMAGLLRSIQLLDDGDE
jgi:hypothetical protein